MKIAILCDHYPLSPRVIKIRNSILKLNKSTEIRIIAWNRNNDLVKENFVDAISDDTGYGNQWRKLMNLTSFAYKTKKKIKSFQPDFIHAIDFEMLAIASIYGKEPSIIYEVYDIKFFSNPIVNWIRAKLEKRILLKRVEGIVLASPFFKQYYENLLDGKLPETIVINNKPTKAQALSINVSNNKFIKIDNKENDIIIGFIGTVRYKDILLNLINAAVKFNNIKVLIAGAGPDFDFIKNYVIESRIENQIILTGRYDSNQIGEIYKLCDYVWAAYPSEDQNVKYAISNKFFEALVYSKRTIISQGTLLGDMVEKYGLGYTLNPYDFDAITDIINILIQDRQVIPSYEISNNLPVWLKDLYWESEEGYIEKLYKGG